MRNESCCYINTIGRIIIPAKIRRQLGLKTNTPVEIFVKDGNINIRKYEESCIFCRSAIHLIPFKEQKICAACFQQFGSGKIVVSIG